MLCTIRSKKGLLRDCNKQINGAGRHMLGLLLCLQEGLILRAQCHKAVFANTEIWANNRESSNSRPRTRSFAGGWVVASSLALRRAGQLKLGLA